MNMILNLLAALKRVTRFSSSANLGTLLRLPVVGLWLGYKAFGNCFRPAVVLTPYKLTRNGRKVVKNADGSIAKDANGKVMWTGGENAYTVQACKLTIRTRTGETTFYWYGRLSFGWSSAHIARWFGTFHDTDFGGIIIYKGLLGHHTDL